MIHVSVISLQYSALGCPSSNQYPTSNNPKLGTPAFLSRPRVGRAAPASNPALPGASLRPHLPSPLFDIGDAGPGPPTPILSVALRLSKGAARNLLCATSPVVRRGVMPYAPTADPHKGAMFGPPSRSVKVAPAGGRGPPRQRAISSRGRVRIRRGVAAGASCPPPPAACNQ